MSTLKELRFNMGISQKRAAELTGISLRSYCSYENDEEKEHSLKYEYLLNKLRSLSQTDENHGILTVAQIAKKCSDLFEHYPVRYCILFGSYAKGTATEKSDVDLLVSTDLSGLRFYELTERLREALRKETDVLDTGQLKNNPALTEEILRYGKRIYEQHER